jgi:hypothetical protein
MVFGSQIRNVTCGLLVGRIWFRGVGRLFGVLLVALLAFVIFVVLFRLGIFLLISLRSVILFGIYGKVRLCKVTSNRV